MTGKRLLPAAWCGALVLTLATSLGARQRDRGVTGESAAAIGRWVTAVQSHAPGRVDDAVNDISVLSYEAREELNAGMPLFLRSLLQLPYSTKGAAEGEIVAMARSAGRPDAAGFLKRAAVLHADVASQSDRVSPAAPTRRAAQRVEELHIGGGLGRTRIEVADAVPPLLIDTQIILNSDGAVAGQIVASWNWPFARSLLDLLDVERAERLIAGRGDPRPARDPFVATWYHATSAQMFSTGAYGDLFPHLSHAARVLPDHQQVLFDRGCYAELVGLPLQQVLASELATSGPRAERNLAPSLPAPDKTNADAERLYQRALAVDPSLAEVHVRLGRLFDVRGRHDEALVHLDAALAAAPAQAVKFLAHLFAGRAAQAAGQTRRASGHYDAALTLYPDAQSALLASSQLALFEAKLDDALAPIARLGARSSEFDADPWWGYQLCSGREASQLMAGLGHSLRP